VVGFPGSAVGGVLLPPVPACPALPAEVPDEGWEPAEGLVDGVVVAADGVVVPEPVSIGGVVVPVPVSTCGVEVATGGVVVAAPVVGAGSGAGCETMTLNESDELLPAVRASDNSRALELVTGVRSRLQI
jgi:hypothetical protein